MGLDGKKFGIGGEGYQLPRVRGPWEVNPRRVGKRKKRKKRSGAMTEE